LDLDDSRMINPTNMPVYLSARVAGNSYDGIAAGFQNTFASFPRRRTRKNR